MTGPYVDAKGHHWHEIHPRLCDMPGCAHLAEVETLWLRVVDDTEMSEAYCAEHFVNFLSSDCRRQALA